MTQRLLFIFLLILTLDLWSSHAFARDYIFLKTGPVYEGITLERSDKAIKFKLKEDGKTYEIPGSEVRAIVSSENDLIVKTSGEVFEGEISKENSKEISFKLRDGKEYSIPRTEVHQVFKAEKKPLSIQTNRKKSEDLPVVAPIENSISHSRFAFSAGLTNIVTTYTVLKNASGVELGSEEKKEGDSSYIEAEYSYQIDASYSLGVISDYSLYDYKKDPPIRKDIHLSFMLLPKAETRINQIGVWAGLGVGLMMTTIRNTSITTSDILVSPISPVRYKSFVFSPRIGADYWLSKYFFAGIQAAYFKSYISLSGLVSESGTPSTVKLNYSRSWWQFGIRTGLSF